MPPPTVRPPANGLNGQVNGAPTHQADRPNPDRPDFAAPLGANRPRPSGRCPRSHRDLGWLDGNDRDLPERRPVQADRVRRGQAPTGHRGQRRRSAAGGQASTAGRGVRLHRWRSRGRAGARPQRRGVPGDPVQPPGPARRLQDRHRHHPVGQAHPPPLDPGPNRIHPDRRSAGRAGGGEGRGPGRRPLRPVDDGHPHHRGGGRGLLRAKVVPGLHLAGSGSGPLPARAGRRGRLRGHPPHRRHRGARPAGAGRASGLHPATQDRSRNDRRRDAPPRLDQGLPPQRPDQLRQRRHRQPGWRRLVGRDPQPSTSTPSSTPPCPGARSSGSARCGTAPS